MTLTRPSKEKRHNLLAKALEVLDDEERNSIFPVLDSLFDLALREDALLHNNVDNPIEHHTTVLDHMMQIAKGEDFADEEIRRAAVISILHDIHPVPRVTREMRELAKTPEEKAKLELKNLENRIMHMGIGSDRARRLLQTVKAENDTCPISEKDVDAICSVIAIHDVPSINIGIPLNATMAVAFREADRLWMQAPLGVKADLARNGINNPSRQECIEQAEKNLKSYRKERALYSSESDGFHDDETFFRTHTGYQIFLRLREEWKRNI